MKIYVSTLSDKDMVISEVGHEEETSSGEVIREKYMRAVIRLREEGIRKALIDLGWTPPNETE